MEKDTLTFEELQQAEPILQIEDLELFFKNDFGQVKIFDLKQKMADNANIIMEGRDIGTVVFPNADVKIFLDCSIEERAKRRYKQNIERGINTSYEEVLSSLIERHKLETEREVAPFKKAEDAILIDSSKLNIEEVTEEVIKIIKETLSQKGKNI